MDAQLVSSGEGKDRHNVTRGWLSGLDRVFAQVKAIAIVADKYLEVLIREKSAGYVGDA